MRFLCAVGTLQAARADWADEGEPVVPQFPPCALNVFLGTRSFKPSLYARVSECPGLDLDKLAAALKAQYPGLPPEMLNAYVLETAKAAYELDLGALCQIFTTPDAARLHVQDTGRLYTLWEKQPIPESYKR